MAEKATAGRQPTYRAKARVAPITHTGSASDCQAWCEAMMGRQVWAVDAKGKRHVVGTITHTESEYFDAK